MPTNKELAQEVAEMRELLASLGIERPQGRVPPEERRDHIAFGSDEHLVFLGLERVDDVAEAEENRYVVYVSPETKQAYRLTDEMQAVQRYPNIDPDKATLLELRQKVSTFESGPPKPHAGAPKRFIPPGDPEYTRIL